MQIKFMHKYYHIILHRIREIIKLYKNNRIESNWASAFHIVVVKPSRFGSGSTLTTNS